MPYFIYSKKTTQVKMVCEEPIAYDEEKFDIVFFDDNDYEGYYLTVVDGNLVKIKI